MVPLDLGENARRDAVQELQKSELINGALGKHNYDKFVEGKLAEWQDYNIQVYPWEVTQYLT